METGWGPYVTLNDNRIGGIGTTPNSDTYNGLTNPGYITNYNNKLLHIIGYWKRNGTYFDRGVYVNGNHYPQKNTYDSGQTDSPSLDADDRKLYIGSQVNNPSQHNSLGIKIYSFRIWHNILDTDTINKLYSYGPNASMMIPRFNQGFSQSRIIKNYYNT